MKTPFIFILAFIFSFATSCKQEAKATNNESDKTSKTQNTIDKTTKNTTDNSTEALKKIIVPLQSKSESNVTGNVIFKEENGIVSMVAVVSGLSEGEHAIHLHEKADCSSNDGKSTGGHWNPTAQPHGKWGAKDGYHKGDIGNFTANEKGQGTITFATNEWCIGCGDTTKDIVGKALIVHQGTDDFTSQPSGAAGSRVSCGGIIQ
ncbi:MAG: superoxide dismutase family protein [Flavobacteriaceae bacterium]|nr:superoxide dismutase family protein [Flavobacteriaceae bacterium]